MPAKIADFSGASRLSFLDSSDCEAIVTSGKATFLIDIGKKVMNKSNILAYIKKGENYANNFIRAIYKCF